MSMNTTHLTWTEDTDGIENCVAIADGKRYDAWYIMDLVAITWGDKAETMRDCLKASAKRYEVIFPGNTRRQYTTLASARRAVEAEAARKYTY